MLERTGLSYEVVRTQPAGSIEEAALLRGVSVDSILKTLVIRRGEGDHIFVILAGDRAIDWAKLRSSLGVRRLSLPDAEEARTVTGYERGAITPFGSSNALPVIIDATIASKGEVSIGGGAHGVSVRLEVQELIPALDAEVADVSRPMG